MYSGNGDEQKRGAEVWEEMNDEFEEFDVDFDSLEVPQDEAAEVAEFLALHKVSEEQVAAMFAMEFNAWDAIYAMRTEDIQSTGVALGRARAVMKAIEARSRRAVTSEAVVMDKVKPYSRRWADIIDPPVKKGTPIVEGGVRFDRFVTSMVLVCCVEDQDFADAIKAVAKDGKIGAQAKHIGTVLDKEGFQALWFGPKRLPDMVQQSMRREVQAGNSLLTLVAALSEQVSVGQKGRQDGMKGALYEPGHEIPRDKGSLVGPFINGFIADVQELRDEGANMDESLLAAGMRKALKLHLGTRDKPVHPFGMIVQQAEYAKMATGTQEALTVDEMVVAIRPMANVLVSEEAQKAARESNAKAYAFSAAVAPHKPKPSPSPALPHPNPLPKEEHSRYKGSFRLGCFQWRCRGACPKPAGKCPEEMAHTPEQCGKPFSDAELEVWPACREGSKCQRGPSCCYKHGDGRSQQEWQVHNKKQAPGAVAKAAMAADAHDLGVGAELEMRRLQVEVEMLKATRAADEATRAADALTAAQQDSEMAVLMAEMLGKEGSQGTRRELYSILTQRLSDILCLRQGMVEAAWEDRQKTSKIKPDVSPNGCGRFRSTCLSAFLPLHPACYRGAKAKRSCGH